MILSTVKRYRIFSLVTDTIWGWLGGTIVLGKLPVPGRPTDLN